MKRFHQLFGIVVVIVFLLTGQYLDIYLNHLDGMPDGPRMLYRTRHIFILLAGLLNLGIGSYFTYRTQTWRRILQMLGSALIVIAPGLFTAAFFYEPKLADLDTPLSHWGMYLIAYGTLFHLFSGLGGETSARKQRLEANYFRALTGRRRIVLSLSDFINKRQLQRVGGQPEFES